MCPSGSIVIVEIGKEGGTTMEWQVIIALVIAIPVILFPAAFVWYVNIGGVVDAVRKARETRQKTAQETVIK